MRTFILIIGVGLVLLAVSSCERWYCCGTTRYICNKGSDTAMVFGPGNDLNNYINKGYSCNLPPNPGIVGGSCVFGPIQKRKAEKEGNICTDEKIECMPWGTFCGDD